MVCLAELLVGQEPRVAGIWAVPGQMVTAVGTASGRGRRVPRWPLAQAEDVQGATSRAAQEAEGLLERGPPGERAERRMRRETPENPGTVLLLKPPIQGTDGQDKREEAEGRWSTEGLCVWPDGCRCSCGFPGCSALPFPAGKQGMHSGVPPESPALLSL